MQEDQTPQTDESVSAETQPTNSEERIAELEAQLAEAKQDVLYARALTSL